VADEGMHTDGGYEASRAGDGQRLPEVSRGPATPDTEEQDEAATPESATKSSAVVCNERNEARADGVEVVGGQLHVFEVLRNENSGHADNEDGSAREHHACACGQEAGASNPGGGTPGAPFPGLPQCGKRRGPVQRATCLH